MKLTDLRVDGFGIWSGITVNHLSEQLTVFYGPNEAGKTTLLQFIRTVLYGFSPERRSRYLPPVHGGKPGGLVSLEGPLGRYYVERHVAFSDSPTSLGDVEVTTPDGGVFGGGALGTLLANVDEAIFNNVFAVGLRELQELNTIDDTAAADLLYKLTSGLDRVSLVDVMRELVASRQRLFAGDDRPSQITALMAQRAKLQSDIDDLSSLERRWSRLTDQRHSLDAEAVELSHLTHDLEHQARLLDITIQVHASWLKRNKLSKEIAGFGPLQELPEGAIEKLDVLQLRLKDQRKKLEEVGSERERVKKEIAAIPVQQALCDSAGKIELYQEQLPWIRQLDDQSKRLQVEANNLETELQSQWGDIQLPEGVSRQKLPEITKKTIAAVMPAAKQVRREASRIKLAAREAEAARGELNELDARLVNTLTERDEEDIPSAIEKASQKVQQLRRRLQVEERLDQLTRQRTELRIATREMDDAGLLPMPKLVLVGGVFVAGIMLALTGLAGSVMYEMTGALVWCVMGLMLIVGSVIGKQVLEKANSNISASTELQLEQLDAQVQSAETERDELDRRLPRGGGALDRRLATAQTELESLEELVPIDAQRKLVQERLAQSEARLLRHQSAAKEARQKWKSSLKASGLPDILAPEHVRTLARRSSELATIRMRLNSLKQEVDQRQRELAQVGIRIGELFQQAELSPASKDLQAQLKQLATALAEAQGYIARRDGLRAQDRALRREQRKLTRRIDDVQRRRKSLLVACGCKNDLQLRERAAYLEEAQRLTRMHTEVAAQIAAMVRPNFTEEQVAAELANTNGTLAERKEDTARRLAEAQARLAEVYQQRGEIQHELKTLVEDRRIAHAQLELASVERQLEKALHKWRVLAATWTVLEKICRLYEAERQPETLIEASAYLTKLTQGQYVRLWTPLGDKALRVDNKNGDSLRLEVLSTGTREAIFLSLRLALIAGYSRRGAKLPIILDDVLVNLDLARMKAAAGVLRDFARNGHQLLLFTCHEHIVEAFRQIKVEVRTLPSREEVPELPAPQPVAVLKPTYFALPIVEIPAPVAELELALEEPLPELEPYVPPKRELVLWDDEELRLSDEELPVAAEYLDDITIDMDPEPEPELDFTVAEAPRFKRPKPLMPPPRPEPVESEQVMLMQEEPSGFEELRYDESESESRTSRFTWESPERWWRDPNEDAA